jgi:tetratricopeptide (TPR) repeat protein
MHLRLNETLQEVTASRGIPPVDAYRVLVDASTHGVVGYENFFTDRVHMTTDGYRLIGAALADRFEAQGVIRREALNRPAGAMKQSDVEDTEDEDLETVLESAPVLTNLGRAALNMDKAEEAARLTQIAVERDPEHIQAYVILGYAYQKMGYTERARSVWSRIQALYQARH